MKTNFSKLLFCVITSMILFACSSGMQSVEVDKTIEKKDEDIADVEKKVLDLVNEYRTNHNMLPLELNEEISEIARGHSKHMAEGSVEMGHDGYDERANSVASIISWDEFGENLAQNNFDEPALASLESWIESPMHHDNLLGEFNFTGIGVAMGENGEFFITQIFIRS